MAYYYPCLPRNMLAFFVAQVCMGMSQNLRPSMRSSLSKSSRFCIYDLKEFSINLGFVGNRIFTHHGTLDIFIFPVQLKPKLLLKIVWRIVILDLDKGFPSGSQSET